MTTLREELDNLGLEIVTLARGDCPLDIKVDAFKAVSQYALGLMRKKQGTGEDEPKSDRPTFGQLRARIRAVEEEKADDSAA